jgi:hypothetical protein
MGFPPLNQSRRYPVHVVISRVHPAAKRLKNIGEPGRRLDQAAGLTVAGLPVVQSLPHLVTQPTLNTARPIGRVSS